MAKDLRRKWASRKYIFSCAWGSWTRTARVNAQTEFGAALKRLRTERNVIQEDLAFRAGLSVQYLRGLEAGRYNPTLNVIFDLGKALGVHPADMVLAIPLDTETWGDKRKRPGPAEGTKG